MIKIDTSDWKEVKIDDLFIIINGKGITKEEIILHPGKVRAIQSGEEQNGCIGYIDEKYCKEKGYYIQYEPCLTVARSGSSGHITYQDKPFVVGDSAKILKNRCEMNLYHFLFIRTILMQKKKKYSYNDKVSEKKYKEEMISLPADSKRNIDWIFMEEYIKRLQADAVSSLNLLNKLSLVSYKPIDISSWQDHRVGKLFSDIVKPFVYHTKDVTEEASGIPYVVRSKFNNGIKYRVKKKEGMKTNPAGVISFGAENATFFYQTEEWCSGRDIYYIDTRNISKNACYFLISCLMSITHKYSYNYGLFPDLLKKEYIKLPTKDGLPDYKYMEQYIQIVEKTAQANLIRII
jgi:hypothetical protein